jgi:hypothetical protein
MPSNRKPLPEIAPCPCGRKECGVVVALNVTKYRAFTDCGYAGPPRATRRAAIVAWNRRSDEAAERRGAMAVARWMRDRPGFEYPSPIQIERAIDPGEVLEKQGGKRR